MKNNINTRLGAGITALALTCTLGLSGCASINDRYTFKTGNDGSFVVDSKTFISNIGLKDIYVVEVKNNITNNKNIYIAKKTVIKSNYTTTEDHLSYTNILNNLEIYNNQTEESKHNLEILEETPLFDYILAYDLSKSRYYYEDMLEIYDKIKEEYNLENNNSMSRKLIIDNNKM